MTENSADTVLLFFGGVLLFVILIVLLLRFFLHVYVPFAENRDYIKMELSRTHGRERAHWKKELRRLYLAQVPFIGEKLAERHRTRN